MTCCDSENIAYAGSCCGGGLKMRRTVLTKQEKIDGLNEYKEQLEAEIAGVTEKIKELKKED
jgi:hypothetical protein